MLKSFGIIGLVGVIVVGYLVTGGVGPLRQLPPEVSLLEGFREDGFMPESRNLPDDHSAEDIGVFEVPAQDEVVLEAALEEMGDMSGMDMSATGGEAMAEGMDMAAAEGEEAMAEGMDMAAAEGEGAMAEGMEMSPSSGALMGEGGLLITDGGEYDRVIELTMTEWGFSEMNIEVKVGERIKFVVVNDGEIPHEFMFMNGPLMAAANYRVTRADWSLLEHEALFEKALMLPGGDFDMVVEIQEAGSWMFMCMLPYHMQLGMMGQMSTPGMAMSM